MGRRGQGTSYAARQKRVAECQDGQCQGDEAIDFNLNPVVVEQWKPVAVQFANNFGAIEGRSSEEWLDSLHPFTIPSLFSRCRRSIPLG